MSFSIWSCFGYRSYYPDLDGLASAFLLLLFPLWRFCSSTDDEEEEADLNELERDSLYSDEEEEEEEEEDFLCLRYLVLDFP
jgi:hypothetical protein